MEVHRQTCQACGSRAVMNILVRDERHPTTVYVKCERCDQLVARYELSAYYHHGKGLESWLRSLGSAAAESGRNMLGEFERVQSDAEEGFRKAVAAIADHDEGA